MSLPDSLLDAVDPPEGMVGWGAILVSMTADDGVLDELMTRFSRLGSRSRCRLGQLSTWLLLDPHGGLERQATRAPGVVPGLLELQPRPSAPGALLHAKLLVLGYAPSTVSTAPVYIRVLVYTGNLTLASMRHQIELLARYDGVVGSFKAQERADLAAVYTLVDTLLTRRFYVPGAPEGPLSRRPRAVLAALQGRSRRTPRFVHSLDEPLLPQIEARLEAGMPTRANLLIAGSGFFEQAGATVRKPRILKALEGLKGLSSTTRRVVVVEPRQAGALAAWAEGRQERGGWEIRAPVDPLDANRSLHAKYIFVGATRGERVHGGCLYLGSGNLSHRGLRSWGAAGGNIECGVVFTGLDSMDLEELGSLAWRDDAAAPEALFDQEGEPGGEAEALVLACPLLAASRTADGSSLALDWASPLPVQGGLEARLEGGWLALEAGAAVLPCNPELHLAVLPLRVVGATLEWRVPVVDAAGRACFEPLVYTGVAHALEILLDFPLPTSDAGSDEDEDGDEDGGGQGVEGAGAGGTDLGDERHALYLAAQFIERVAAHQAGLEPGWIGSWIEHLDRMLAGKPPARVVDRWRELGLSVLDELQAEALEPAGCSAEDRLAYRACLRRHARAWGGL